MLIKFFDEVPYVFFQKMIKKQNHHSAVQLFLVFNRNRYIMLQLLEVNYRKKRSPAVRGFASDAKESRIESQQGCLINSVVHFTILNFIGVEVLIKVRIALYLPLLMYG